MPIQSCGQSVSARRGGQYTEIGCAAPEIKIDDVVRKFAFSSHWRPYALEDELADIHSWGTFDVFAVEKLSRG